MYCTEYILSDCGKKMCCYDCSTSDCNQRCHHYERYKTPCKSLVKDDPDYYLALEDKVE